MLFETQKWYFYRFISGQSFTMKDKAVIYLKQIEEAIEKFVFEYLVNIDEKFARTQNLSPKEIQMELNWQAQIKERMTFIALVTMGHNDILLLGIAAKGKTSWCEEKYQISIPNKDFITYSQLGSFYSFLN